ncbi:MAG TPA: hypothetical protein VFK36_06320 [Gemmatimonadales bacterium]|nr:hypothetical protein [Gemmatimonadales bacterium]
MTPLVTFVIPVRHQDNARDWAALKANLTQTMASIANQTRDDWRAIIVANEEADLPELPPGFEVEWVTFPPNEMHERRGADLDAFLEAFRFDKGRRVLKGMLRARDSRFFMIVDDDDFVSARLVEHAARHPDANGWVVSRGYIWNDGGRLLLQYNEFNRLCGTSLMIRSDLYGLPQCFEHADCDWIKATLGSHLRIAGILADAGTPLETLPFRGAIYRVAHPVSHSTAPSLLHTYFLSSKALRRPGRVLRDAVKLRWLNRKLRREFFGRGA